MGLRLIVTAAILFGPGQASAQALWGSATVAEDLGALRQAFPDASPPSRPLVLSAGEVEGLLARGRDLDGRPAEAHFFFRDGKLSSVQLRTPDLSAERSPSNLAFARQVAQGYTAAYGQPYSCVDDRFAAITRFECRWLKGQVVVHESYLDVAGQAPVFYVAFRRADDPAFDS